MPNWCYTTYALCSGEEKALKNVLEFCKDAVDNYEYPDEYSGASSEWLGKLMLAAGKDPKDISCRGFIQEVQDSISSYTDSFGNENYYFYIYAEDAWGPHPEFFDALIALSPFSSCKDLKYFYEAEEPGMGVYVNTDTSYGALKTKWKVECFSDGYDMEEYFDAGEEDSLFSFFDNNFEFAAESLEDICCFCESKNAESLGLRLLQFLPD